METGNPLSAINNWTKCGVLLGESSGWFPAGRPAVSYSSARHRVSASVFMRTGAQQLQTGFFKDTGRPKVQ